ncbi:MAG: hypothetical protein WDN66_03320 [Candidatus Saccharibacteria bacterium]
MFNQFFVQSVSVYSSIISHQGAPTLNSLISHGSFVDPPLVLGEVTELLVELLSAKAICSPHPIGEDELMPCWTCGLTGNGTVAALGVTTPSPSGVIRSLVSNGKLVGVCLFQLPTALSGVTGELGAGTITT